jgi:signal transduction histidine kinase
MWAILVHFSDSLLNQSGDYFQRFIIVVVLHFLIFFTLFVATRLYINRVSPTYVPITLFLTICLVGMGRGYLFDMWLYSWEIVETLRIGFRMRSSLLNTAVSFVIVVIAIANTRRHKMIAGQLLRERAQLENTKSVATEQIEQFHQTLVTSISADIKMRVEEMSGKSAQEVLFMLHELINKVVQPLSRNLATQNRLWTPGFISNPKFKISWRALLSRSFNPGKVNYITIPLLLTLIVFPTILLRSSLIQATLGLILTNTVAISLGFLFRKIYVKRQGSTFEYFIVVSVTGLSLGIASSYLTQDYENKNSLFLPGLLFYFISSIILSLISGAEEQRTAAESELKLTVEQLEWNVARIREIQRQDYRRLSRNLHDRVQAQLSSKYLELQKLIAQDDLTNDNLSIVITGLHGLIDGLSDRQQCIDPIDVVVERVKENWSSIAKISLESDPKTLKTIEEDLLCRTSIIDVIPELVFNGIKHGKATEIELLLELIGEERVRLSVIDNGNFEKVESATGLGTTILNEACISWTRERSNSRTVTVTDFAFIPHL